MPPDLGVQVGEELSHDGGDGGKSKNKVSL